MEQVFPVQTVLDHDRFVVSHGFTSCQNQVDVSAHLFDGRQWEKFDENETDRRDDQKGKDHQDQTFKYIFPHNYETPIN